MASFRRIPTNVQEETEKAVRRNMDFCVQLFRIGTLQGVTTQSKTSARGNRNPRVRRWSFPRAGIRIPARGVFYFSTPSSLPTLMKAAMHLSRCSRLWPAES